MGRKVPDVTEKSKCTSFSKVIAIRRNTIISAALKLFDRPIDRSPHYTLQTAIRL